MPLFDKLCCFFRTGVSQESPDSAIGRLILLFEILVQIAGKKLCQCRKLGSRNALPPLAMLAGLA